MLDVSFSYNISSLLLLFYVVGEKDTSSSECVSVAPGVESELQMKYVDCVFRVKRRVMERKKCDTTSRT